MIVFISSFEDECLKTFSENFNNTYNIKSQYLLTTEFLQNQTFSICSDKNNFSSEILNRNSKDIKICFINSQIYINPSDFAYKNVKDSDYAIQEWSASFLALLGIDENIKFVNPYFSRYNFNSEIEQLLILQQSGLDTVEMILSNNSLDVIDFYKIWNKNVLMKEATLGYNKSKNFNEEHFLKLDKLNLTPCIFQKCGVGENIEILILGDKYLAINCETNNLIKIPVGLKERLISFCKNCNIKFATFNALLQNEKYYFYSVNQNPVFSIVNSTYEENFTTLFENFLIKEYNN